MKNLYLRNILSLFIVLLLSATIIAAQGSQQAAPAYELYHIHIVAAAPGKLPELIEAYKNAPGPSADEPQVTPIMLRHAQGGAWDLIVITPLGKQTTITASVPPQAVQDFNARLAPLSSWHGDTFAIGPVWTIVQKMLVPAKGEPIYQVSDYRSLPGHRAQLQKVLVDSPAAERSVLFAHIEGAPWNFLNITRFDSWAELGAPPQPAAEGATQQQTGLALRTHMAVHHDTIATYVSGGQPIK